MNKKQQEVEYQVWEWEGGRVLSQPESLARVLDRQASLIDSAIREVVGRLKEGGARTEIATRISALEVRIRAHLETEEGLLMIPPSDGDRLAVHAMFNLHHLIKSDLVFVRKGLRSPKQRDIFLKEGLEWLERDFNRYHYEAHVALHDFKAV